MQITGQSNNIQLLILIPSSRAGHWDLIKWLWWTCQHAPFFVAWNTVTGRPEDDARNRIVQRFLQNPRDVFSFWPVPEQLHYTHLMMIDDDILPPANAYEMALHDKAIVSAVVFTWQEGAPLALIMKWDEAEQGFKPDIESLQKLNNGERLVSTDASGTGCFCVRREVYENLVTNCFRHQYDDDGLVTLSEDFAFYKRVMDMGYKVWIDGAVKCGHVGQVNLLEIQNLLVRQQQKEQKEGDLS